MTDPVAIALIGLVQTLAICYFGYKQRIQGAHIAEIKKATNGMSKKLEDAAQAKGKLEGAQEQRDSDQQTKT
jgi:hypothetical protein